MQNAMSYTYVGGFTVNTLPKIYATSKIKFKQI